MTRATGSVAVSPVAAVTGPAAAFVAATEALDYVTVAGAPFLDITDDVLAAVARSGVRAGQVTVFSQHTTASIRVNENEPLLLRDMARLLRACAPEGHYYEHNDFERRTVHMTENECPNGHAHCRHLLLGNSETIPVVEGVPVLGTYQRIFLVELDHARQRRVLVSVVGIR